MAQKVTVALEDDLDGGPAEETVRFGLDGTDYEIDLSAKNARAFRKKLAPFIEHPRKASRGPTGRTARTSAGRRPGPQVGQRPRRRGQRPRPDPGQRIGAVPGRRYGTLNQPEAPDFPRRLQVPITERDWSRYHRRAYRRLGVGMAFAGLCSARRTSSSGRVLAGI